MGWTHPGSKAHDDEGAITILEHEVHANTALAVALESKPVVAAEMSQKATRPSVTRELLPRARALCLRMLYVLEAGAYVRAARGRAAKGAHDSIIGR